MPDPIDERLADSAEAARSNKEPEDDFWAPQRHSDARAEVRYPRPTPGASLGSSLQGLVNGVLRTANALLRLVLLPFVHRTLRWVTAAVVVAVVIGNTGPARAALGSALAAMGEPLHERAAFTWRETFQNASRPWVPVSALDPAGDGVVRVRGLVLQTKTQGLKTYGLDFSARADKKSIGWVVRAADPADYFVFKLIERGRSPRGLKFDLVRYAVVHGQAPPVDQRKSVPVIVIGGTDDFVDISARVTDDQILTLVNGFGVDTWKNPEVRNGAIGLLAEDGESFLVKSMTISGNDDFLGLFLWGAEQTFKSVKQVAGQVVEARRTKGV